MFNNLNVLLVNDDGYNAQGIKELAKIAKENFKKVIVVAPFKEQSAVSHAMTLRKGMKFEKQPDIIPGVDTYSLDGRPSDCVKFAVIHLKYKPDLVLSGINNGLNLGDDILYSGTVACCFEAGLMNIKSIAFSCEIGEFETSKYVLDTLLYIYNNERLKNELILNVNMPLNSKGYKITKQGRNPFNTYFEEIDGLYYAKGTPLGYKTETDDTTDVYNYHHGYISITPLTFDRTNYK